MNWEMWRGVGGRLVAAGYSGSRIKYRMTLLKSLGCLRRTIGPAMLGVKNALTHRGRGKLLRHGMRYREGRGDRLFHPQERR